MREVTNGPRGPRGGLSPSPVRGTESRTDAPLQARKGVRDERGGYRGDCSRGKRASVAPPYRPEPVPVSGSVTGACEAACPNGRMGAVCGGG